MVAFKGVQQLGHFVLPRKELGLSRIDRRGKLEKLGAVLIEVSPLVL